MADDNQENQTNPEIPNQDQTPAEDNNLKAAEIEEKDIEAIAIDKIAEEIKGLEASINPNNAVETERKIASLKIQGDSLAKQFNLDGKMAKLDNIANRAEQKAEVEEKLEIPGMKPNHKSHHPHILLPEGDRKVADQVQNVLKGLGGFVPNDKPYKDVMDTPGADKIFKEKSEKFAKDSSHNPMDRTPPKK